MKVFTARFFGGTCTVAIGSLAILVGIVSLFPPASTVFLGIILMLVGIALTKFGFTVARDKPPAGSKTAVDTLRRAKMVDKK